MDQDETTLDSNPLTDTQEKVEEAIARHPQLYVVKKDGDKLVKPRATAGYPRPATALRVPPPDAVGSIDWFGHLLFGGAEKTVEMLETIVAGAGESADPLWVEFCILYRQWQLDFSNGKLERPPTLNEVAFRLRINDKDLSDFLVASTRDIQGKIASVRASLASPQMVDTAIMAGSTVEGFKDREMILRIAGVVQETKGTTVNVNQQVGIRVGQKGVGALRQFVDTSDALDDAVRDGSNEVVEGQVVDE